jgi:hypothetical protein
MSSESRTGTRSSSAHRLGALAKGTVVDPLNGGALTLGWTSPADDQAHERRRSFGPLAAALSRLRGREGERKKWGLGFWAKRSRRSFVLARDAHHRWSQMDSQRCFGLDSAQVGGWNVGPGLRPRVWFPSGLGRTKIVLLSHFWLKYI